MALRRNEWDRCHVAAVGIREVAGAQLVRNRIDQGPNFGFPSELRCHWKIRTLGTHAGLHPRASSPLGEQGKLFLGTEPTGGRVVPAREQSRRQGARRASPGLPSCSVWSSRAQGQRASPSRLPHRPSAWAASHSLGTRLLGRVWRQGCSISRAVQPPHQALGLPLRSSR